MSNDTPQRFILRSSRRDGREWWDVIDTETGRSPAGSTEFRRAQKLADKYNRAYALIAKADRLYAEARSILDD